MMGAMGFPRRWLLVAALAVAASCGGSNDTTNDTTTTDTTATDTTATDMTGTSDDVTATAEEPDPTGPPAPTAASTPDPETPDPETPDPETPAAELSDLDGLAVITVTTPSSGNGEHPLLSWNPIDGAERYTLTLSPPGGAAYYSWTGTTPSMTLGGPADERVADAAGPILLTDMVLRVVAFDETGAITAASAPTPIAP